MSHFDSCQLTLIWLVRITLNWQPWWKRSFLSFSFLCWCDILYQLICRENDLSFIWAREMVMWLLAADVWFWQLPIHPHTDGLQSVNFSKIWHLTSAKHEVCIRVSVRYVITKFSRMVSLPNFLTHGAPEARASRARELRYKWYSLFLPTKYLIDKNWFFFYLLNSLWILKYLQ